jgi:hypothetical protein
MNGEIWKLEDGGNEAISSTYASHLRWACSVLSRSCIFAIAPGILLLCVTTGSWAAPAKKSCDDPDVYSRIKCKQDGLVVQMEHMVDENLTKGATGLKVTEHQKQMMKNGKAKARLLQKHTRTDDFKSVVKGIAKRNKDDGCDWIPLIDDNENGICDWPEEECEAENYPGERCDPRAKKDNTNSERYVCAEVCTLESSSAQYSLMEAGVAEEVEMEEVALDLEDTYDVLEDNLIESNETLEAFNALLDSRLIATSLSSDPCDNIAPLPEGFEISSHLLRVASALARAIYNAVESSTRQTVVGVAFGFGGGGNTSAVGFFVATVAGIAEQGYIAVDAIVSEKQSELQGNTFSCLQEAVSGIAAVDGKVDASATMTQEKIIEAKEELSEQMAEFKQEMRTMLDNAISLLNTPQGQRADFSGN